MEEAGVGFPFVRILTDRWRDGKQGSDRDYPRPGEERRTRAGDVD